jgi:putative nucleotidyltransferase with HDIG domain
MRKNTCADALTIGWNRDVSTLFPHATAVCGVMFGIGDELTNEPLIALLAEHDPVTGLHSLGCARYARALAEAAGLAPDDVALVERGGLLHDVGKLTIPAELLAAPRALTASEWMVMRTHAHAGGRLAARTVPARIVPLIRDHHERLDGSGYPRGLRGEAIDLPTQIISVADTIDALLSDRPYRAACSRADVCERLDVSRGPFDTALVDLAIDLLYDGPTAYRADRPRADSPPIPRA